MDLRHIATAAVHIIAALVVAGSLGLAAEWEPLEDRVSRLEQQNALLLEQNAELMRQLDAGLLNGPSRLAPVTAESSLATSQATTAADVESHEQWMEVGKNLDMTAEWRHGLWLETKDKAFKFHPGGAVQYDVAWMTGDDDLQFAEGGVGNLDDAANFRRIRLSVEGSVYEVCNFVAEFDFINAFNFDPEVPAFQGNVANTPVPTDVWVQITQLPVLGTVRAGNMKPPISFEHLTTFKFLNFMERSLAFDAFIGGLDNGFRPGFMTFNATEDRRVTWALGAFKNNTTIFGWNTGDGEWDVTGRLTYLPYYADQGRHLIHLGLGASHRDLDEGVVRLRARTLLRNGPPPLHTPLVNILVAGDDETLLVPEFAMNWGPWTVQSEYYAAWVHDAVFPVEDGTAQGTAFFQSAYVELMYFLTGEHKPYNMVGGSGAAYTRVVPNSYFFRVRDEFGSLITSPGAWQVGVRYSWIDLNSRGITGGTANDVTFGLNWYLNPNVQFQWNYSIADRDVNGPADGQVHGFGMRTAFDF